MRIFKYSSGKFNKWEPGSIVTVSIIKFDSFPLLYNELHMHRICVNNLAIHQKRRSMKCQFIFFFFFNFLPFLRESRTEHRIQLDDANNRKIVSSISRVFKERYHCIVHITTRGFLISLLF